MVKIKSTNNGSIAFNVIPGNNEAPNINLMLGSACSVTVYPKNYMQEYVKPYPNGPTMTPYSLGMGAAGLPGDLSSASRFVRAVFTRNHMKTYDKEEIAIAQFFHLLDIVSQTEGCVKTKNGLEKTIYSSCCNTDKGIYYYTTSANRQITAVMLTRQNMDTSSLSHYPLRYENNILYENKRV